MTARMRSTAILLAVTVAGCAGNRRPAVAAAPAESLVGDYRLSGRIAGIRIGGSIRFDSTGRAMFLRGGTPAAAFTCDGPQWLSDGDVELTCGAVQVRLAVANGVVAREGTLTFDAAKPARREFDPFACPVDQTGVTCTPIGQETRSTVVRRYRGRVAVQRVVVD